MEEIKNFLLKQKEGWFKGPINEKSVDKAENILQCKLPRSFRYFLTNFGYGDIAGKEIFGILRDPEIDPPNTPNFVWYNIDERKTGHPNDLIIFSIDGLGNHVCFDTSKINEEGECQVVFWNYGSGQCLSDINYPNFLSWLESEMNFN